MRKVQKPIENAKEVFRTCISIVDDQNLKQRLVSIETNIEQAANEFDLAASTATIHTLLPHDNVAVIVSKKEMVDVYNYRMVKKETPGRAIYDKLRLAPKYGICPLCGHCPVSTVLVQRE